MALQSVDEASLRDALAPPEQYDSSVLQAMVSEVWRFVYLTLSPLLTRSNADALFTVLLTALQQFTFAAGEACTHPAI